MRAVPKAAVAALFAAISAGGASARAAAPPHDPIVHIAEIEVDPAHLDAFREILAEEQAASVRLEPGVLMLHSVAIADHPTQIRLLEVYADEAAYQAHLKGANFLKYKTATEKMITSLRLIPTTPILLCAKGGPARGAPFC